MAGPIPRLIAREPELTVNDREMRRSLRTSDTKAQVKRTTKGILYAIRHFSPTHLIHDDTDLTMDEFRRFCDELFSHPPRQWYVFHPEHGLMLVQRNPDGSHTMTPQEGEHDTGTSATASSAV